MLYKGRERRGQIATYWILVSDIVRYKRVLCCWFEELLGCKSVRPLLTFDRLCESRGSAIGRLGADQGLNQIT